MADTLKMPEDDKEISECLVCQTPLGYDTKAVGYVVCRNHWFCTKCNGICRPSEIIWCIKNNYPLAHASCLTLQMQKEEVPLELLNINMNLIYPDMGLSVDSNQKASEMAVDRLVAYMDHDQLYMVQLKAQATAAAISVKLSKDRSKIEREINERERKKFAKVQEERVKKTYTKSDKKADAKHGMEGLTMREKGIKVLMKNSFLTREEAEKVYADGVALHEANKNMSKQ